MILWSREGVIPWGCGAVKAWGPGFHYWLFRDVRFVLPGRARAEMVQSVEVQRRFPLNVQRLLFTDYCSLFTAYCSPFTVNPPRS